MSAVQPFDFSGQQVRVDLGEDGEPWFIASDVCDHFGVTNRNRVMQGIDPEDKGGTQIDTPGGTQTVTTINESGLYSLLFALRPTKARGVSDEQIERREEQVRTFRRWVTHEVLPAIRKTGSYSTAPTTPALTEDEIVHQALQITARKVEQLTERVAELEPPARAWDHLASAAGDYSVNEAAKTLSRDHSVLIGERRLFTRMQTWKWIYRHEGDWRPYQTQVDCGRLSTRARSHHHPRSGELVIDPPQVRITTKGLGEMLQRLTAADEAAS